ncbi:hypothetical protein HDE_06827 [Halotydeus destructor]|nr:hypothetical protein HDE_06827 [Halotydeus destructor]
MTMSKATQLLQRAIISRDCCEAEVVNLVKDGADGLASNGKGTTLLMAAINRRCSLDILRAVLPSRPDIRLNSRNENGDTAFSLAVLVYDSGNIGDLLQLLRKAGSDFTMSPNSGRSIISVALRNKYTYGQIRYLVQNGTVVQAEDISEAIKQSRLDIVHFLLNSSTEESLQLCCKLPNVLTLLVKNFDESKANFGQLCRVFGKLLIDFRLDANYTDNMTPPVLHMLILKWKKNFNRVLDVLLQCPKLDVNVTGSQSPHTSLTLALNHGHYRLAERLVLLGSNVQRTSVQNILLRPGFSRTLKLLILHGFKVPESFGHFPRIKFNSPEEPMTNDTLRFDRIKLDRSNQVTANEVKNFSTWYKTLPVPFPSLQTLAARTVRPYCTMYLSLFDQLGYSSHFRRNFSKLVSLS